MVKLRKGIRILGLGLTVLALIFLSLFTWVDRTPTHEMTYYESTIDRLEQLATQQPGSGQDTLQFGWGKVNMTPPQPMPLAGYGKRRGKEFRSVNDSIWVRALVFDNGRLKSALVTFDLLIVPPQVEQNLDAALKELGFENNFYTASHSHSSMGSWAGGVTGRLFAGKFAPSTIDTITNQAIRAVVTADQNKAKGWIGYAAFKTEGLVYNRLVQDRGDIDPWLRIVQLKKRDSTTAVFASFAAHATCLSASFEDLSGDYPGFLVRQLEASPQIDFAAFGAGAMASQGPVMDGSDQLLGAARIASDLAGQVALGLNFMPIDFTSELATLHLPVELRQPHFRISENIRMRPWVFDQLVGSYPVKIKVLRIGQILMVGTPCDFSGELMNDLEVRARDRGLNLLITSFNGGYIGYITKDKWYDEDLYETRTMNWYGPYNGAYFSELIAGIIDLPWSE